MSPYRSAASQQGTAPARLRHLTTPTMSVGRRCACATAQGAGGEYDPCRPAGRCEAATCCSHASLHRPLAVRAGQRRNMCRARLLLCELPATGAGSNVPQLRLLTAHQRACTTASNEPSAEASDNITVHTWCPTRIRSSRAVPQASHAAQQVPSTEFARASSRRRGVDLFL